MAAVTLNANHQYGLFWNLVTSLLSIFQHFVFTQFKQEQYYATIDFQTFPKSKQASQLLLIFFYKYAMVIFLKSKIMRIFYVVALLYPKGVLKVHSSMDIV